MSKTTETLAAQGIKIGHDAKTDEITIRIPLEQWRAGKVDTLSERGNAYIGIKAVLSECVGTIPKGLYFSASLSCKPTDYIVGKGFVVPAKTEPKASESLSDQQVDKLKKIIGNKAKLEKLMTIIDLL